MGYFQENLRTECESELNEKVQQAVARIKEELAQEKRDILIKAESEKNLLHVDFEKEKERYDQRTVLPPKRSWSRYLLLI